MSSLSNLSARNGLAPYNVISQLNIFQVMKQAKIPGFNDPIQNITILETFLSADQRALEGDR